MRKLILDIVFCSITIYISEINIIIFIFTDTFKTTKKKEKKKKNAK